MQVSQLALVGAGTVPTAALWEGWLADPDTAARFRAKVHRRGPEQCWYWWGAIGSDGHGVFRAGSRTTATSWVVAAHVFAYQLEHGLCRDRLITPTDVVIRHRCDEASCENPRHLAVGTARVNAAEYRTRRHRIGGPLSDLRGAAGRARAIRRVIHASNRDRGDTTAVEAVIAAAMAAGDRHAHQPALFVP